MGGAGGNEIKYQCEVISVDSAFTRIQGCLLHTHYFIYMLKEKNGGRETVGSWDGTGAVGGGGRGGERQRRLTTSIQSYNYVRVQRTDLQE